MREVKKCEVVGYSERGMVNELVHMIRSSDDQIDLTRGLLEKCFQWESESTRKKVEAISHEMKSVTFIVEPGFAQFGDPDLIIVPRDESGENSAVFFVEAKVISYRHSAELTHDAMDMTQSGYNSTIIGQLSLRYRLAKALAHRFCGESDSSVILQETEEVAKSYASMERLSDGCVRRRRLAKRENLMHLLPLVRLDSNSEEDFMNRCFFVALTSDEEIPFKEKCALRENRHVIGYEQGSNARVPRYYKESGKMPVYSETAIENTGWVGWQSIREEFRKRGAMTTGFETTWKLAFPEQRERTQANNCTSSHTTIRTQSWDDVNLPQEIMRAHWEDAYLSNQTSKADDSLRYIKGKGSDSGLLGNQTFFKLLNLKDECILGLREDLDITLDASFNRPICINGVPFQGRSMPSGEEVAAVEQAISMYIDALRERYQS